MFSEAAVAALDHTSKLSVALDGSKYLPGIVGLNNIKVRSPTCTLTSGIAMTTATGK